MSACHGAWIDACALQVSICRCRCEKLLPVWRCVRKVYHTCFVVCQPGMRPHMCCSMCAMWCARRCFLLKGLCACCSGCARSSFLSYCLIHHIALPIESRPHPCWTSQGLVSCLLCAAPCCVCKSAPRLPPVFVPQGSAALESVPISMVSFHRGQS